MKDNVKEDEGIDFDATDNADIDHGYILEPFNMRRETQARAVGPSFWAHLLLVSPQGARGPKDRMGMLPLYMHLLLITYCW